MLTLELAPEIEKYLQTLAEKQGIEPKIYVENLLANVLPLIAKQSGEQNQQWKKIAQQLEQSRRKAESLTPAERTAALREWVAMPRPVVPSLSDEALSRESIYGERG
jgi:16S rRNA C1402 N4-methylase RsmH